MAFHSVLMVFRKATAFPLGRAIHSFHGT